MKGTDTVLHTIKGRLIIIADENIVRISTTPLVVLDWMQVVELRNRLTKMVDNKRARDRLKYK